MRDREEIEAELRLIASARRSMPEPDDHTSRRKADELLDEHLGHHPEAPEIEAVDAHETWLTAVTRRFGKPRWRNDVRPGLLPLTALGLSLVAVALAMVLAIYHPAPATHPPKLPPPRAHSHPAPPIALAPPPIPPAPPRAPAPLKAPVSPSHIVDRAFVDALTREGVPVPSNEYATTHGHAVCDFLTHQSNFAKAVNFVRRSTIWDANQSTDVTAGAIISYCPEYEESEVVAGTSEIQKTYQKSLADLQAIERNLQSIRDGMPTFPPDQQ